MKVKIIFAVLLIVVVAYGISITSAKNSATAQGISGGEIAMSPAVLAVYSPATAVSSASSNGLGVGGVSGHTGITSLIRTDGSGLPVLILDGRPVQESIFAMNDETGKPIIILTRSYTDSIWSDTANQFIYRALMKITAMDTIDGTILWEKTVITDTNTI